MKKKQKIEFISYSGTYPCLCMGTLKLKINDKVFTFKDHTTNETRNTYPRFWMSGGNVSFDKDWNANVTKGEWQLNTHEVKQYPREIKGNIEEILKIFNENVTYGCCGGCI